MGASGFPVDSYLAEHGAGARGMMGSSDPDPLSLREMRVDLARFADEPLGYALGNGYPALLDRLSELYETVAPSQIAVMSGDEEAIYVTMRALLERGDEVVVHMPSHQSLWAIAKQIGCTVVDFRPEFERGWAFDIGKLASAITPKTKMLVLNYPHNPTGACLTDAEMAAIVQLCRRRDIRLVSDEAYRFLRLDERCSNASFADLYENAVALGSFSKVFAAPGLRLGWVATRNGRFMQKALSYRHYTSTCQNLPCQWAASELLRRRDEIIGRNNGIVRRNAAMLERFVQKHAELFSYVAPKGATVAYVKLLDERGAAAFCRELLAATGVLLVPSSVLEDSDEFLRVGLCRTSFPRCVQLVDEYLSHRS